MRLFCALALALVACGGKVDHPLGDGGTVATCNDPHLAFTGCVPPSSSAGCTDGTSPCILCATETTCLDSEHRLCVKDCSSCFASAGGGGACANP